MTRRNTNDLGAASTGLAILVGGSLVGLAAIVPMASANEAAQRYHAAIPADYASEAAERYNSALRNAGARPGSEAVRERRP